MARHPDAPSILPDEHQCFGASDIGRSRSENQDAILVSPDWGCFAVADGLGGHRGGREASRMAIDILSQNVKLFFSKERATQQPSAALLIEWFHSAHRTIRDIAQTDAQLMGMGTTLTVLLRAPTGFWWSAHVGDSRIYGWRPDGFWCLTEDHTQATDRLRQGLYSHEEARASESRHALDQCLGAPLPLKVPVTQIPDQLFSFLLLCSDGLNGYLSDYEISEVINEVHLGNFSLASGVHRLIALANDRGGGDNISAILIKT